MRLASLQLILTPIVLMILGGMIGLLMLIVMAPLITLINSLF